KTLVFLACPRAAAARPRTWSGRRASRGEAASRHLVGHRPQQPGDAVAQGALALESVPQVGVPDAVDAGNSQRGVTECEHVHDGQSFWWANEQPPELRRSPEAPVALRVRVKHSETRLPLLCLRQE